MVMKADTGRFEDTGNGHIVDVTHGIEILETRIDARDEAICVGTEPPGFGFGHVLLSLKLFFSLLAQRSCDAMFAAKMPRLRPL
jgi:hypothetical protein